MMGEAEALTIFVSKSSARPVAIFAIKSAVAGAITIASVIGLVVSNKR